jgi:hypothetical protein
MERLPRPVRSLHSPHPSSTSVAWGPARAIRGIDAYLLLSARTVWSRTRYRTNKTTALPALGAGGRTAQSSGVRDLAVAAADRSVRSCRAVWCAVTSQEEPGGLGEAAAAGWPGETSRYTRFCAVRPTSHPPREPRSCAALSASACPSPGCRRLCSVAARRPAHAHGRRTGDASPAPCPPCRLVGTSDTRWVRSRGHQPLRPEPGTSPHSASCSRLRPCRPWRLGTALPPALRPGLPWSSRQRPRRRDSGRAVDRAWSTAWVP